MAYVAQGNLVATTTTTTLPFAQPAISSGRGA